MIDYIEVDGKLTPLESIHITWADRFGEVLTGTLVDYCQSCVRDCELSFFINA